MQTLFSKVADKRILDAFFYHMKPDVLPAEFKPDSLPAIMVFKDDLHYQYKGEKTYKHIIKISESMEFGTHLLVSI